MNPHTHAHTHTHTQTLLALSNWPFVSASGGFPFKMANNAELWYLLCCQHGQQTVEQTFELPVTWASMTHMWRHCNCHPNVIKNYEIVWEMTFVCILPLAFNPGISITLIRVVVYIKLSVKIYGDIKFHSLALFCIWPESYDTAQGNCSNKRISLWKSFQTPISRNLTIQLHVFQLHNRWIFSFWEQQDHCRAVFEIIK